MKINNNNYLLIWVVLWAYLVVSLCVFFPHPATALAGEDEERGSIPAPVPARHGTAVKKDQRWSVASSEFGEISAVKISDGRDGFYHLQFITMEPNSLFLPVHLHSDMVFYVDSGSGTLSWIDIEKNDKLQQVDLQTGDVYRLRTGSFFYLQSNLESERRKLRIYAIFSDSKEEIREGSSFGAYASVRDLVLGFDNKVLQAALNITEEVIEEFKKGEKESLIVHGVPDAKNSLWEVHYQIIRAFLGPMKNGVLNANKHNDKAYNILTAKHDVENSYGWSLVVTKKQLHALKGSDFGIFLVNLTKGAMMGPHWNPMTVEIAIVLQGQGMVQVVCPSAANEKECKNLRFKVKEGDIFAVPRYHPMTQISFNNESFVFMGFTTTTKKNHPQYLAGKASALQVLDKSVLTTAFNVSNTTMDQVLLAQKEVIILECVSCAEEEEQLMEEEIKREKEETRKEEEEKARREQEAARKREEKEAKRREEEKEREEKEEETKRQEEEARKREEEEARKEQEEARKRGEQEAKEREEEARRQQEKAAAEAAKRQQEEKEKARRQQQEEATKRHKEEEAARHQAEEEAARQQEEEAVRRQQQEEEAARRKQQEEKAARRQQQEEEAAKHQEEEAAQQKQQKEEEEATRQQQEDEDARHQEEEAARRKQEEEAARWKQHEEEAARRQQQEKEAARHQEEEETARQQEEETVRWKQQEEEAAQRQEEEEEAARRQHEEGKRQEQEEEEARQREEETHGGGRHGHQGHGEEEAASKEEEEMERQIRETEEEATRAREAKQKGGQDGVSFDE